MSADTTRKKALSGSVWTLAGYGSAQVIRLAGNLVLAHLLFPAAFGLMALVTVLMQGLQMFSEIGIGPSIIQNKRGTDPRFLNTAWTIQVIRGFCLWFLTCALAWPAAAFFSRNDPMAAGLLHLMPVVGFCSVLAGFNSTSLFTLNRDLKIAQITLLELVPQLVSVAAMILWAWLAPSIWALAGGWIIYNLVKLPLSHWMNRPLRNRFAWNAESANELLRFGKWIFLGTIVAFLAGSLDRLLLGKLLSLPELGIYSIALTFARVGIEVTTRLSHTVLFPILSRNQENPAALVSQALQARKLILFAGGGLVSAFAILAPEFFKSLYDPRYAGAGVIAQWLALQVWCMILLSSMERVPLALGHPKALFVSNLVTTLGYGLAVPAYWKFGLPGFIVSLAVGALLAHTVLLRWVPVRRWDMVVQDLVCSAVFGIYTCAILFLVHPALSSSGLILRWAILLGAGALPCAFGGIMVLLTLKNRT